MVNTNAPALSTTSTSSTSPAPTSSSGLPPAAIGGIVGGFVGLLAIVALLFFCWTRRSRQIAREDPSPAVDPEYHSPKYGEAGFQDSDDVNGRIRYPDAVDYVDPGPVGAERNEIPGGRIYG